MLYGAYKTGYLSGGYNINTQATPRTNPDTLIFGPEKVKGGEIGSKFWLFDRQLKLSLVGYYYKYAGLQEAIFNTVLISYTVQNAAASKRKGIEFQEEVSLGGGFVMTVRINYKEDRKSTRLN